jgi:hypothetical protein
MRSCYEKSCESCASLWPIIRNLRQYVVPVRLAPAVSFLRSWRLGGSIQSVVHPRPSVFIRGSSAVFKVDKLK